MLIKFPTTDGDVTVNLDDAIGFANVGDRLCIVIRSTDGDRKMQTNASWEEFVKFIYTAQQGGYKLVRESDLFRG